LNRTQTSCNKNKTPYEIWTGRKSYLGHIRVFGSEAYVHVPKQLRKKWDKMILVGYQGDSCNYRLYNPQSGRITFSRNVIIHEASDHSFEKMKNEASLPIGTKSLIQEKADIENKDSDDENHEEKR